MLPSTHPDDFARLTTDELRERFLAEGLFRDETPTWALAADDRLLLGGLMARPEPVALDAPPELHAPSLLVRRELAVVALDRDMTVTVDDHDHDLAALDVLYVGAGDRRSVSVAGSGRVYLVSAPAHATYPDAVVRRDEADATRLGDPESANVRTVRRYVHAGGVRSANLVLGVTTLEPGSVWNTMPPHTHARRTEAYLYTGLGDGARVVHLAGPPDATRSAVLEDGDVVVSPGWSVHLGVGTRAYSFVWAMAGENQDYGDMDGVAIEDLR
jgi:4-deoxy-L-threo-5-hexosulose-uronate ketol-isomerase